MSQVRVVQIREQILAENMIEASTVRERLNSAGVTLVNVMSSPGSGKTSVILQTIAALRDRYRIAVVEADLDSTVDADKINEVGINAVQLETGGFCHVDARMTSVALSLLDLTSLDLLFLENVGNLVCPAQTDTGSHINVVILSVPEGDDKPLKYPVIFASVDAVLINKMDYLEVADFDEDAVRSRVRTLNDKADIFALSCKTGDGISGWIQWLEERIAKR